MTLLLALLLAQEADASGTEKIDVPVRELALDDLLGGPRVALSSFKGKKAVVLVFTSYTCDACLVYEERIRALIRGLSGRDVAFLALRSSAEDRPDGMRAYAKKAGFGIPFLDDSRNAVADRYGVRVTPSFRLIDKDGVLRYRGALDDSLEPKDVKVSYLRDAIAAVLEGREPPVKESRSVGCVMPRVQDEVR